jgi:hypothetical protein
MATKRPSKRASGKKSKLEGREFPYTSLHGYPVLPPAKKRPLYRMANRDGLSWVTDVYSRALGSLDRVAASDCCVDEEARRAANAVRAVLRELAQLDPDEPTTEKGSFALARSVLALGEGLAREISPELPPGVGSADRVMRAGARLAPHANMPIFADIITPGGQVPIPPDEAGRILAELIRILEEAIRQAAGANGNLARARELLEMLRRYRDLVMAGGAVTLSELAAFLKPFFAELLTILRGLLSREAWISLGRALVGICEQLAEYLGGTACAATVAFLWYVVAILAAAGLGWLVGRLIGKIRIGGRSIDEHVQDFFYWLFYAPPDGCDEAYDEYMKALERTRQLEASGASKEARIASLSQAIVMLQQFIDLKCLDDLHPFELMRDQLLDKLRALNKR